MTKEQVSDLHNIIVDTIIKYLSDNNIDDCDEIDFIIDGLKESVKFKEWVPSTDSGLCCYKYINKENGLEKELIFESL